MNLPELPNISHFNNFLTEEVAKELYEKILSEVEFKSEFYNFNGNVIESKRKISYHSEYAYEYSGQAYSGKPWTETLSLLREMIFQQTGIEFNAVLCNFYENGSAGMGWHSDKEKNLGSNPVIASVSFGQKRKFAFRYRKELVNEKNPKKICEYLLGNGDLLIMGENTQNYFEHSLLQDKSTSPRLNLTFRNIIV